jgi:hypothetical protein
LGHAFEEGFVGALHEALAAGGMDGREAGGHCSLVDDAGRLGDGVAAARLGVLVGMDTTG